MEILLEIAEERVLEVPHHKDAQEPFGQLRNFCRGIVGDRPIEFLGFFHHVASQHFENAYLVLGAQPTEIDSPIMLVLKLRSWPNGNSARDRRGEGP